MLNMTSVLPLLDGQTDGYDLVAVSFLDDVVRLNSRVWVTRLDLENGVPHDTLRARAKEILDMTNGVTFGFGVALDHLKAGKRVARRGWNGKGMYIWVVRGQFDGPERGFLPGEDIPHDHPSTQDGVSMGLFNSGPAETPLLMPYLCMRAASGAGVTGWLASQTDMLAEDWMLA